MTTLLSLLQILVMPHNIKALFPKKMERNYQFIEEALLFLKIIHKHFEKSLPPP